MKVEESCLPCHAEHGYQVGNIRGGLSLEVPIAWADQAITRNNRYLLLIGLATFAATALAIFLLMDHLVVKRLAGLAGAMRDLPPASSRFRKSSGRTGRDWRAEPQFY